MRHRRRAFLIACALLLIVAALVLSGATRLTPYVRDRVVAVLNVRFESTVDLQSLQVSIFPRPDMTGGGLTLRHKGRLDVPPIISIKSFSAGAGLFGLIGRPLHLGTIHLDALNIHVPPGGLNPTGGNNAATKTGDQPAEAKTSPPEPVPASPHEPGGSPIVVDRIISTSARLEIIPKDARKLPRVFEIHDLLMHDFAFDRPARFQATLTNPKPTGRIDTNGVFGPWHKDEPRLTPVRGQYVFKNANLDTIKGIGGVLTSTGRFDGVLERIEVEGETDTPDFVVDTGGQPVPLKTRFKAVVDGTNGNTWLDPVHATLLSSTIVARGGVVRTREVKGRQVSLDVTIAEGRIEDLLKLAVKSTKPPLTGRVALETKFLLPAGDEDVVRRLQLNGRFSLAQARFTNFNVQRRIDTLSRRGRGDTNDSVGESVVSNLHGRFVMKDGSLRFSELTFAVPGAVVQLAGSYELQRETMDFTGYLLLDATLAETTSGVKAVVARIAQPLFRRKGGGTKLPIRVSGPRAKPSFGLDVKRALTPG